MDDGKAMVKPKSITKGHSNPLNGRIILCSVIIILTAVLILFCFRTYARWLSNRHHTHRRRREAVHHLHHLFSVTANDAAVEGLDLSVLKALATFVYNTKSHYQTQECAVCLSEFQENEKVRVLPKCKHTFHVDCIDLWFHSHSNCALCRVPVQSDNITEMTVDVTIIPVEEQAGSEPTLLCEKEEDEIGCSSSGCAASLSSE